MKALLVITLTACGIYAVPLRSDDWEVDLVPPRRVYTASRAVPATTDSDYWPGNMRHTLRRLFGAGFPSLVPRVNPNCDSGKFQLSNDVYEMVENCQRSQGAEQDFRQCIMAGLPENATELKKFLDRDEYRIVGISSSLSVVIVNTKVTLKRAGTFTLCPPSDARNTAEDDGTQHVPQRPPFQPGRPIFPYSTGLFGTARPKFQFPDLFSQENPFFNFDDAFRPFFNNRPGGVFPPFPSFDFDDTDFPSYDPESCVKQTFQLPKEQFDEAKNCHFTTNSFKECLREQLSNSEEAKDLLQFVADQQQIVVDRRFFSSVSSINGEVTRKNKIQLMRCQGADNGETVEQAQEGTDSPSESMPNTEQQAYIGEEFEP